MISARVAASSGGLALCLASGALAATGIGQLLVALAAAVSAAFVVRIRWSISIIVQSVLFVMAGYILLNRNFAELHVTVGGLPFYVGELLLVVGLPWAITHWPRHLTRTHTVFFAMLGLWLAYATARLLSSDLSSGLNAIRDFAIAYYAVFAIIGYAVWPMMPRKVWIAFFALVFIALIPVAAVTALQGPFGLPIPGEDPVAPTKADRADVMAVGLLAAATFFLLALRTARFTLARLILSSAALTLLLPLEVRAATIGAVAVLGIFAVQHRWRTLLSLIGLPVVAFALISLAGVQFRGRSSDGSPEALIGRQFSTFSILAGGQAVDAAASGDYWTQDTAVDTVAWRLAWWNALSNDVGSTLQGALFGVGFGSDLTGPLGLPVDNSVSRPLRSPHNFLLTLFARTGLVGLALWVGFVLAWLHPMLAAIRSAAHDGNQRDADWLLWFLAYPVALLIAALFGVVLEGPFGAMPFYLLLGMGLRASEALIPQTQHARAGHQKALSAWRGLPVRG